MMKFLVVSLAFCALIGQLCAQTPRSSSPPPSSPPPSSPPPTSNGGSTRNPIGRIENEIEEIQESLHDVIEERAHIQMCSLPVAVRMFVNGLESLRELEGIPERRGFDEVSFKAIKDAVGKLKEPFEKLREFCGPEEKDKKEVLEMRNLLERFLKIKSRRNIK